jgi:DNA invertase Pin-like site-specific DNA recombinase
MLIGYARVSTNDQDTTAQASALKAAGCERIFREKATGGRWNRPELQRLLDLSVKETCSSSGSWIDFRDPYEMC